MKIRIRPTALLPVLCLGFAALLPHLGIAAETAHPLGFPTAVGSVAEKITHLYNFIFWIITVIFLVVTLPLLYIIYRYRKGKNPKPAKFSHHLGLEIVWTAIPALITIALAWKSFEALTYIRTIPEQGLTVEAIGYQFGWDFYYPDFAEGPTNIAVPAPDAPHELLSSAGEERYVKDIVVPLNVPIKIHTTSSDVIHAFYAPDVGIKIDSMPGRINYAWFTATREGEFIGQCAELCGSAHGEMFFTITAVPMERFVTFINDQRAVEGLDPLTETVMKERMGLLESTAEADV